MSENTKTNIPRLVRRRKVDEEKIKEVGTKTEEMGKATQERFKRQTQIFNPYSTQDAISVIGAGNIGGQTAWGLAKMGLRTITVYDFDVVEEHNLASQFYGIEDIGKYKVECLAEHIRKFTGIEIIKRDRYIDQGIEGILIIAVDSIPMREQIAEAVKVNPPKVIIDGRMGGNVIEIYTKRNVEEYKKTLSRSVNSMPCSARYISYTSLVCAGLIVNQVKRFLNGEPLKESMAIDLETLRFA